MKQPNPWIPVSDPVELAHLSKLGEETNELGAAVGRCIMQGFDESHPETGKANRQWVEEEIADVLANIELLVDYYSLDKGKIVARADMKKAHLRGWHTLLMEGINGDS